MNLLETIEDILEQEDYILPKKENDAKLNYTFDEKMFDKMANFIINLDPDKLNDVQLERAMEMIEDLEVQVDDDIEETLKLAKRTSSMKNQYSKEWYRNNRTKVKERKKDFERSFTKRHRDNHRDIKRRQGKTDTGRDKVRYHVRKRSKRGDRDATLNR